MKNKVNRKIEAVIIIAVMFLVTAISIPVDATPPITSEEIILNFSFAPPEIAM